MGRTYRYDAENGLYPRRRRKNRYADEIKPDASEEVAPKDAVDNDDPYGPIDPDWAIGRMKRCVEIMVGNLVKDNTIQEWQRCEYEQLVYIRIWRVSPTYDPTRLGKDGRKSTKVHFLEQVVASTIKNIRRDIGLSQRRFKTVPIGDTYAVDDDGSEDENNSRIFNEFVGDNSRWARDIDLILDFPVIKEKCSEDELTCLLMRCDNASEEAIAAEINLQRERKAGFDGKVAYVNRHTVRRVLIPALQRIARECGYYPPWETADV